MASDCVSEPKIEGQLDDETGEVFQTVICLRSSQYFQGPLREIRQTCESDSMERTRFRIPLEMRSHICQGVPKLRKGTPEERIVDRTENFNMIVFMLPTLIMFPAWASILCAFAEASIHIWTHKRNRKAKEFQIVYKSPLNLISSEFCAKCRTEKWMQKISEIQDKRSLRRNLIDPNVIKQVVR